MSDQNNPITPNTDNSIALPTRIFKTGAIRIVEAENMRGLSNEQVRDLLKRSYPEIANATMRETVQEDGSLLVEWVPAAGRKG